MLSERGDVMIHYEIIIIIYIIINVNMWLLFQGCVRWLLSPTMETKLEQNFKTLTSKLKSMCNFKRPYCSIKYFG